MDKASQASVNHLHLIISDISFEWVSDGRANFRFQIALISPLYFFSKSIVIIPLVRFYCKCSHTWLLHETCPKSIKDTCTKPWLTWSWHVPVSTATLHVMTLILSHTSQYCKQNARPFTPHSVWSSKCSTMRKDLNKNVVTILGMAIYTVLQKCK